MQRLLPASDLTVVANTADDDEFWGLLVCPDIDAVLYRLADVFNDQAGYGVRDDTFEVLGALSRIGEDTWFRIGDRDLATHIARHDLMLSGCTLTAATLTLCERFGVATRILPMTDGRVRTRFSTDIGELSFQEYFVRERLKPAMRGIKLATDEMDEPVHATQEVRDAIASADLVVIGPSNPLISIDPILQLTGELLEPARTVAVTPIVGGVSLKGPTVDMMRALGLDPSPFEVARFYRAHAGTFVLDERDQGLASAIEQLGYRVLVCDTVMKDGGEALARAILGHV
jgi:LPPG:FO 2-phospho-L-lactate transferase